jgi:type VI secretion system secreted protein VgrG
MQLELLSEEKAIKFEDIVGKNVTARLSLPGGKVRYFNGYVSRFYQAGQERRLANYIATVVPWLWFLTQTSDCRIFQEKTVPDIIKEVFRDYGFTDFEDLLSGSYRTWEYCVQYRETAFNFVSRLMEQEGIYYFFKHEDGKHTLVLADSSAAHTSYPGYDEIRFHPPVGELREEEYIYDWRVEQKVHPGAYSHTDFDFQKPRKNLTASRESDRPGADLKYEVFDYPGEYVELSDGDAYARTRIEEIQADYEVVQGEASARGMSAGFTFLVKNLLRQDQEGTYLITRATLFASTDAYDSGDAGAGDTFGCSFTAIDSTVAYRSRRVTPKPWIRGPQTAIVVGPKGEEIYPDKYGRVKVQFHWDRRSKADENSSCWMRVAQIWAGKEWGGIYIPRVGQEVVVEFLEGDPDRPIITGRVYNGQAMPPYGLPGNKTVSTVKSNSSKGGGGCNEIRFEDKKGKEQLLIHAQQNEDICVKNDAKELIGRDRHLIVKRDQFEQVDRDKHLTVKGDHNQKVDGTVSLTAGMDFQHKVGMKQALEAGLEIHLKAGMKVIIEGGLQVTLKGPGGFVDIGPAGVTIQGTLVNINSGGAAGSGSGCSPGSAKPPKEAACAEPGETLEPPKAPKPPKPFQYSAQATVLKQAAKDGTPFCEKCAAAAAAAQKGK